MRISDSLKDKIEQLNRDLYASHPSSQIKRAIELDDTDQLRPHLNQMLFNQRTILSNQPNDSKKLLPIEYAMFLGKANVFKLMYDWSKQQKIQNALTIILTFCHEQHPKFLNYLIENHTDDFLLSQLNDEFGLSPINADIIFVDVLQRKISVLEYAVYIYQNNPQLIHQVYRWVSSVDQQTEAAIGIIRFCHLHYPEFFRYFLYQFDTIFDSQIWDKLATELKLDPIEQQLVIPEEKSQPKLSILQYATYIYTDKPALLNGLYEWLITRQKNITALQVIFKLIFDHGMLACLRKFLNIHGKRINASLLTTFLTRNPPKTYANYLSECKSNGQLIQVLFRFFLRRHIVSDAPDQLQTLIQLSIAPIPLPTLSALSPVGESMEMTPLQFAITKRKQLAFTFLFNEKSDAESVLNFILRYQIQDFLKFFIREFEESIKMFFETSSTISGIPTREYLQQINNPRISQQLEPFLPTHIDLTPDSKSRRLSNSGSNVTLLLPTPSSSTRSSPSRCIPHE